MGYKVVVVGATGNVGREMLNILAERQFPVDEITALASRRSLGTEVSFGDRTLKTKDLDQFDFVGLGHRLLRGGVRGHEGLCAEGREGRLRGDRQLVALPLRPGRPAGGAPR